MSQLRKIEDGTQSFKGKSGKVYNVRGVNWRRRAMMEKFQIAFAYGVSFEDIFKDYKDLFDTVSNMNVNKILFKDLEKIKATCHNRIVNLRNLDKSPYFINICACFINADGEDETKITEEQIKDKIEDWDDIDDIFFLKLGAASMRGLTEVLESIKQMEKESEDLL